MSRFHENPVMHVKEITLSITNLDQSIEFYKNVVGLSLLKKEENSAVFGGEHPILRLTENKKLIKNTQKLGLYHFAILVPNRVVLANLFKRLIELQYPITGVSDHLVSEAIYFDDPDGNGVEVFFDKNPEGWITDLEGRPIFTQPMDLDELYSQANEDYLKPLPKTTCLGHLHLHVGDFSQAEHFYVDLLGFQTMLKFRNSAQFTSDNGYHHHLAFNLWARTKDVNDESPGLINYVVSVTSNKFSEIKENLLSNNYPFINIEEDSKLEVKDVNDTTVIVWAY